MSLYIIVWVSMCLVYSKDILFNTNKKAKCIEFEVFFAVFSVMLVCRYGQGTDYFNYLLNYALLPEYGVDITRYQYIHGEIGWLLWGNCFRASGLPYECFIASVSIIQLAALHRFCRVCDVRDIFVLLWVYPTVYLTYFFSGMRQGLVIAIFLGFMLPMLERRNYVGYILLGIVMISIHGGSFVLLLLPVVMKISVRTALILTLI